MPIERKLAAIMFTDIAGYTEQMSKDEAVAISLLNKKESVLKPLIKKHNGTYVKSTGDGSLSHFNSAVDAATCAKRFQESIYDDKDLNVRVGVHLGDTIFEKGDIRGDGVNIASRLESMAVAGGVFVSKEVHDQLANQKEFEGISIGMQSLKGVGRLIEVYGLKGDKLNEPEPKDYEKDYCGCHSDDEVPSVVILPFKNKGKEEDEFYSYGIWLDLITEVSGAGLIRVASKQQIDEMGDVSIKGIPNKLCVRYIVTGELWKLEDKFQLFIELYDTKEFKVVWTDRWQENWDNLPSIKGNLSDGLLKALDTTSKVEKKVETTNIEAYEFYLKAKHKYEKRENTDDTEIARGLLNKAIELDDNLIMAKKLLGNTYLDMGDYDNAMEIYTSALKQANELSDKYRMGQNLNNIGTVYYIKGDYNKALDCFNRSLRIKEEFGDKYGMGISLVNLGGVYIEKGDHDTALEYYERSLKIQEELCSKRGIGISLGNIGRVYIKKGDHDTALDYYERSLKIREELGDKYGMGLNLMSIGDVYGGNGDLDTSLDYYERSLKIREELGDKSGLGVGLGNIGLVFHAKGDYEKALGYYDRSLKIKEELGYKRGVGICLSNIGLYYNDIGDYEKSLDYLEKSLSIQEEIGLKEGYLMLETTTYLYLTYKNLGREYDKNVIHSLIKETENIEYYLNYRLYQLLEDPSYLEKTYNQVQEKADNLEDDIAAKFLSYPIPKAIVEEWEKVK